MTDNLRRMTRPGYVLQWGNQNVAIINVLVISNNLAEEAIFYNYQTILAFIIPLLVGLLQLRYPTENGGSTPFQAHPITTWIAISSLLAYCLVFWARLKLPMIWAVHHHELHSHTFMEVLGLISVVSLESLLLPGSWGFVTYIMLVILNRKMRGVQQRMRRGRHPLLPRTSMDLTVRD